LTRNEKQKGPKEMETPLRIEVVLGPPVASDEVGLEYPLRVRISIADQIAWGLTQIEHWR